MMRALLAALAVLALVGASPVLASGGEDAETSQTADALALQGLAVLEQGLSTSIAVEKLDEVLTAAPGGEVDRADVQLARDAAARGDRRRATILLEGAFPPDMAHVVGVTLRPGRGGSAIGAGVIGAVLILLAAVALRRAPGSTRNDLDG